MNHPISLDAEPEEPERIGPAASDEDPERVYYREWFRSLMRLSVEALRESLRRDGKETHFEVFRMYHLRADAGTAGDPAEKPSYGDIAARVSIQESDVGNYLILARRALDRILRERIRGRPRCDSRPFSVKLLRRKFLGHRFHFRNPTD